MDTSSPYQNIASVIIKIGGELNILEPNHCIFEGRRRKRAVTLV